MYWIEVRSTIQRVGPPRLVPLADVGKYTGFRSVCAYDDETAELIREQGSTRFLRGRPVYADVLLVDFDNTDPSPFRNYLRSAGLAFEEYDSGNRSAHFHIPLVPIFGAWVPEAMKRFMKEHGPTADMSFYHPAGQYRLPGTYHAKRPGRCKTLIAKSDGQPLTLEPPLKHKELSFEFAENEDAEAQLFLLITQAKGEGHRSMHLWRIAATAAEAGRTFDEALEHMRFWNSRFAAVPHDDSVLQKHCESAFRRQARKVGA